MLIILSFSFDVVKPAVEIIQDFLPIDVGHAWVAMIVHAKLDAVAIKVGVKAVS